VTKTPSVADRVATGKATRKARPRTALGEYAPAANRPDPVQVLASQETDRISGLLPLRHQRMSVNPFALLRGAAAVMAGDLGAMPNTGLTVQLCGDAHLSNLGLFAGPDRALVFDLNDFDETNPGPFEWDVMRLATSFTVAAQVAGHSKKFAQTLPGIVAKTYRKSMAMFAGMNDLDVWYYRIDTTLLTAWAKQQGSQKGVKAVRSTERAAARKDRWSAAKSLTQVVDGRRVFKDQPPLLVSLSADEEAKNVIGAMLAKYRETLLVDRAHLLSRYHWVDAGHKVVGVGSVGLLAFVLLLQGRDENDLLVLQFKEAVASVLEPYTAPSTWPTHGQRVVAGQRLIQASTDAFLGATDGPAGRSYYGRQLRDMKWSPDPLTMSKQAYAAYAQLCGVALARAHARSGDSIAIAAYLGSSPAFDRAIAAFADAYAAQTELDFARYTQAIKAGEVSTEGEADGPVRMRLETSPNGVIAVTTGFGPTS
jgi:uncharacterized protein (DUF2252 family)